jgi:anthranilate phosphoribosyltransferase
MPARKELGVRTIFNCLGPLTNPARATHQVVGVFSDALRPILARTLAELGTQAAWIVRGSDGLDEISPYGPTRISSLRAGVVSEIEVRPQDFGVQPSPPGATQGGDAQHNAAIIEQVLRGEPHPARDGFVLNAAAALVVANDMPLPEAATLARTQLDSGAALATLQRWKQVCTELAAG